jgi:hypothetical protein
MLEEKKFQMKALLLGSKLSGLWLFTYQALTLGVTPERMDAIRRVLSEVNRLHTEMFPALEHSLYGDDFLLMIENVDGDLPFTILDKPPDLPEDVRRALDEDWDQAQGVRARSPDDF